VAVTDAGTQPGIDVGTVFGHAFETPTERFKIIPALGVVVGFLELDHLEH